jgi:leucyl aminopeptidase
MKITLGKGSTDKAPKSYTRIKFVNEKGVKRLVRENGVETIEIGVPQPMNRRKFITLCRTIITSAKHFKAKKIAVQFDTTPNLWKGMQETDPGRISQLAAENYEMANFEFRKFKSVPKEGWTTVEEIVVYGPWNKEVAAGAKRGQLIGQEVNKARELANTPGGHMTPRTLAQAAKNAVKGIPTVTVKTFGRAELTKLGMGLLAGVGSGSTNEPTFTVMQYKGGTGKPIVLAGKGITFDSGGLNIKSSPHIYEMHMDMSGAAAVIHAVALAAKLKVKKNVIGLIPAAENMPGNNAIRPGDILTSLSGKTVEVSDTDAEGRLVLADAITYAKRFNPSVLVDVATLTGAVMVALGLHASGVMSRDEDLARRFQELGEESGDYAWPLPLWDEYERVVKSDFADMINYPLAKDYGGAIGGGMFLWQFAKELDCPWVHIDMASRMTAHPLDELAKGAAGAPVRLLLRFIETWKG